MIRRAIGIAATLSIFGGDALAQAASPDSAQRTGASSIELWTGYSPGSTSAGVLGRHGGVTLGVAALRFNRRVRRYGERSLYYTFDVIPVARVAPLIRYVGPGGHTPREVLECEPPTFDCQRVGVPANGVGISPLGWTMVYSIDRALQWRTGVNAGILLFDRPTPSDLASRFNFTASVEAGVQLVNRRGHGILFVYRLHHLSNAGMASDNLAMLSHVFSIGMTWRTDDGRPRAGR